VLENLILILIFSFCWHAFEYDGLMDLAFAISRQKLAAQAEANTDIDFES
jgi:hypothetical protein